MEVEMVDLFPHQKKAVEKLGNGKVLWGDVGTGKTITAMAYYMANEAPKDVYVITTAKKRDSLDWETDAAKYGVGKYEGGTVAGLLHVDSWNNIHKYTEVKDAFFIFDEQRLVGSGAWVKSFYKIARANRWILLTATPGDTWLDYAPVFIANGWYKNITDFRRQHVVYTYHQKFPKVDRYIGVNRLVKNRHRVLVEMPYLRHTRRVVTDVEVEYDKQLYDQVVKKKWHVYEKRPLKDLAEWFIVQRKVVNSHPSRLATVRELLTRHPKLIVFYNFDYELEELRKLARPLSGSEMSCEGISKTACSNSTELQTQSKLEKTQSKSSRSTASEPLAIPQSTTPSFAVAEWNGHKHEAIPQTASWVYLVQYVAGAEAWDCTETDAMCFYSLTYSYKTFHQAMGRIDRLNTPFEVLRYYVLVSKSMVDTAVRKSLKAKKSFNESAFVLNTPEY